MSHQFLEYRKFSADLKFSGTWFQSLAPSCVILFNPKVAEFILDNEILFLSNIEMRSQRKFFHAGRIEFIESFVCKLCILLTFSSAVVLYLVI